MSKSAKRATRLENAQALRRVLKNDAELMVAFKNRRGNDFITSIFTNFLKWGGLTDKQASSVKRAGAGAAKFAKIKKEREAVLAKAPAIRNGKYTFTGKVVSKKEKSTRFGYAWKILVESTSGNRLWGSVPRAILDDVEVGKVVKITASVMRSSDDIHFGFFSRPKGEVIES